MTRTYESQDYCPVARTLDVIGDRWTILVLRDVNLGITKFSDLLESLKGISPNLLAQRLKRLEKESILERSFYCDHPPRAEYRLTRKGRDLGPVLTGMAEWGIAYELDEGARKHPRVQQVVARIEKAREHAGNQD